MWGINKKGQSLIEYSTLIALVVAASLAMQVYVQRGWGASIRVGVRKLTLDTSGSGVEQYEPYYMVSAQNVAALPYKETDEMKVNGEVFRSSNDKVTIRSGYQRVTASP